MARQKVTLSVDPETFKKFKEVKVIQGLSISAWVNSHMLKEIEKQKSHKKKLKTVVTILREEYPGLTDNTSDKQILNDVITVLMARSFNNPSLNQMYHALDNLD